jgi:hypothetical protein
MTVTNPRESPSGIHTQPEPIVHRAFLLRRRLTAFGVIGFVALPFAGAALDFPVGRVPQWVGVVLLFAAAGLFLLAAFSWRCPRCGYFLTSTWRPRHCWQCGVGLC